MTHAPRLLVFGATGRTGRQFVTLAHARGLTVAAFVRDPARAPEEASEVHVGDVRDAARVRAAMRPGDVLVSTLGGNPSEGAGGALSEGARVLAACAREAGAARLLAVVGAGVLQLDADRLRSEAPDYPARLRPIGAEHAALHRAFAESGLPWGLVCTPRLIDGGETGRLVAQANFLPEGEGSVTTGDVAALLLTLAVDPRAPTGRVGVNSRAASSA